jgi:hypothetical protein
MESSRNAFEDNSSVPINPKVKELLAKILGFTSLMLYILSKYFNKRNLETLLSGVDSKCIEIHV